MNKLNYFYFLIIIFSLFIISCGKPISQFQYTIENNEAPSKVDFENECKNAEEYHWDFGDGNTSTDASPEHEYTSSGNYTVKLTAKNGNKTKTIEKQVFITAPENCLILIETSMGNMVAELYDATPLHRDNFIKLVEEGFYDELLFHRVIKGFMIQGGDPESKNAAADKRLGTGGPGYQIPAEFVDSLVHIKGAICAARTNNPEKKSSGSQFYIVQGKKVDSNTLNSICSRKGFRYSSSDIEKYETLGGTPHLDREYTVFGKIIEGLEIIDKIAETKTGPGDRPLENVKMKISIIK